MIADAVLLLSVMLKDMVSPFVPSVPNRSRLIGFETADVDGVLRAEEGLDLFDASAECIRR
jgi:hypothetical protein